MKYLLAACLLLSACGVQYECRDAQGRLRATITHWPEYPPEVEQRRLEAACIVLAGTLRSGIKVNWGEEL